MKKLILTKNKVALVDDDVFEYLSQWKWLVTGRNADYAARRIYPKEGKSKLIYLHRFIMNCPSDMQVDHINGNTLDNRKQNLRIVTSQQNSFNCLHVRKNKLGYQGVYERKNLKIKKYVALLSHKGKFVHVGYFVSPQEAHEAYLMKRKELRGEYARM